MFTLLSLYLFSCDIACVTESLLYFAWSQGGIYALTLVRRVQYYRYIVILSHWLSLSSTGIDCTPDRDIYVYWALYVCENR